MAKKEFDTYVLTDLADEFDLPRFTAHDALGDSFVRAVTHVLGTRPPQFEAMSVKGTDDPLDLVPAARALLARLDTGEGVLVVTDIYGASPSNLARKLLAPGRVEAVAGVSLPMLVRALTYRGKGMETMVTNARPAA